MPAIITILAMDPPAATPGRVRFIRSASAPLAPSALRRFEETFGIPVVETYGMTEAASMITANPLDGPRKAGLGGPARRYRGPGRPRDATCRRARPARSAGCRSGAAASSWSTRRAAASAFDADGWLETGDLGHLDQDGYLFLAGRSDDVINRGGEKIYPREIEDFLLTQPGRLGPPRWSRPRRGTRAAAGRLRGPGYGPRRAGSGGRAARGVRGGAFPGPSGPTGFCLVPELPLGATGKVSRRRLRELAAAPA